MHFLDSYRQHRPAFWVSFLATLLSGVAVRAADFTVASGVTDTTAKTLAAGEVGVIDAGGVLNVTTAHAITASGDGVRITNNGALLTSGSSHHGMSSSGTRATLINNGTFSGTGSFSRGMHSSGDNSSISNTGTITATLFGISSTGANGMINNSGAISGTGTGINVTGANSTITHSGTITSTESRGISTLTGSGIKIIVTQSGKITVNFVNRSAISSESADGTITISGTLIATGAATQAISGSNNQTLNIMPGATIVGTIDLGGGTNAVNVYTTSGARSSTLTIANAGTVNTAGGGDGLVVQSGTTVAIIDTTSLAANRAGLSATTVGIHQAVSQQLARSNKPQAVQVAASELEPGMLHQDQMPFVWGQVFGGHKQRGDDGAALAYTNNTFGAIGGYERSMGEHSVGVFGGTSQSRMKTDIASIKANADSVFVGGYGEYAMGAWALDGALVAGYQRHDDQRLVVDNLKGEQTARAQYNSVYISPSVALIRTFDMGGNFVLRPSAEVNYTYGYYGRYSETGTTSSNLTVDDHGADVVNGRLQLASRQPFARKQGELEFRGGMAYSYLGRDSTDISLNNGAIVRYQGTGDTRSRGGYVGTNARYDVGTQMTLVADMEYGRASRNEQSVTGYVGLEYRY